MKQTGMDCYLLANTPTVGRASSARRYTTSRCRAIHGRDARATSHRAAARSGRDKARPYYRFSNDYQKESVGAGLVIELVEIKPAWLLDPSEAGLEEY